MKFLKNLLYLAVSFIVGFCSCLYMYYSHKLYKTMPLDYCIADSCVSDTVYIDSTRVDTFRTEEPNFIIKSIDSVSIDTISVVVNGAVTSSKYKITFKK